MEEGQKIDINLESPIDVKSSDMLVSVNDAKFAHNRQRYQGHVLPTSLRYEHDGWAAGWYVYEFDYTSSYLFAANTGAGNAGVPYLAASRVKVNDTPTYVISFRVAKQSSDPTDPTDASGNHYHVEKPKEFQAYFNAKSVVYDNPAFDEKPSITSENGKETEISFKYYTHTALFKYNNWTGLLLPQTGSFSNIEVVGAVNKGLDGTITATIRDTSQVWKNDIIYCIPKDVGCFSFESYNGSTKVYTFKANFGAQSLTFYGKAGEKYSTTTAGPFNQDSLSMSFMTPIKIQVGCKKVYNGIYLYDRPASESDLYNDVGIKAVASTMSNDDTKEADLENTVNTTGLSFTVSPDKTYRYSQEEADFGYAQFILSRSIKQTIKLDSRYTPINTTVLKNTAFIMNWCNYMSLNLAQGGDGYTYNRDVLSVESWPKNVNFKSQDATEEEVQFASRWLCIGSNNMQITLGGEVHNCDVYYYIVPSAIEESLALNWESEATVSGGAYEGRVLGKMRSYSKEFNNNRNLYGFYLPDQFAVDDYARANLRFEEDPVVATKDNIWRAGELRHVMYYNLCISVDYSQLGSYTFDTPWRLTTTVPTAIFWPANFFGSFTWYEYDSENQKIGEHTKYGLIDSALAISSMPNIRPDISQGFYKFDDIANVNESFKLVIIDRDTGKQLVGLEDTQKLSTETDDLGWAGPSLNPKLTGEDATFDISVNVNVGVLLTLYKADSDNTANGISLLIGKNPAGSGDPYLEGVGADADKVTISDEPFVSLQGMRFSAYWDSSSKQYIQRLPTESVDIISLLYSEKVPGSHYAGTDCVFWLTYFSEYQPQYQCTNNLRKIYWESSEKLTDHFNSIKYTHFNSEPSPGALVEVTWIGDDKPKVTGPLNIFVFHVNGSIHDGFTYKYEDYLPLLKCEDASINPDDTITVKYNMQGSYKDASGDQTYDKQLLEVKLPLSSIYVPNSLPAALPTSETVATDIKADVVGCVYDITALTGVTGTRAGTNIDDILTVLGAISVKSLSAKFVKSPATETIYNAVELKAHVTTGSTADLDLSSPAQEKTFSELIKSNLELVYSKPSYTDGVSTTLIITPKEVYGETLYSTGARTNGAVYYDKATGTIVQTIAANNNKYSYNIALDQLDLTIGTTRMEKVEHTISNDNITNWMSGSVGWNIVPTAVLSFKPKGIYKVTTYDGTTVSGYDITNTGLYNIHSRVKQGNSYYTTDTAFNLNTGFDGLPDAKLDYNCTDVRTGKTKKIASIVCKNEKQLVKQQWDATVETEDFWWLDSQRILKLTKDQFIVLHKDGDGAVDDWDGDKWYKEAEFPRTDFLTSDVSRCIVTSGSYAKLVCLSAKSDSEISVTVYKYDMSTHKFTSTELTLTITNQSIKVYTKDETPVPLVTASPVEYTLYTYSNISASSLLSECKLTAYSGTDNASDVKLGIQYDRNLCQWTVNLQSGRVILGYGCVGIDGSLTGGMIPSEFFDKEKGGFIGAVQPLSALASEPIDTSELEKFNDWEEKIVGDENQQWYIYKLITGIVSHINSKGEVQIIPLTNNYAQIYESPSFIKSTAFDKAIQQKDLREILNDKENSDLLNVIFNLAYPAIMFYFNPFNNMINYLQQTLGQYAYVHYNSTSRGRKGDRALEEQTLDIAGLDNIDSFGNNKYDDRHVSPLLSDDLSFDVIHIQQEQAFNTSRIFDGSLGSLFTDILISAADMTVHQPMVNMSQNEVGLSDIAKKYGQAFLNNINSMQVTGLNQQSTKPMLKSEVTAVKTLDMFYSTSADQKCYAGPGFVNLNFVAQCVAQSVTSVQLEAQQTEVMLAIKFMTTWVAKLAHIVVDASASFLHRLAQSQGGTAFAMGGVSTGASFGWITALALETSAYALEGTVRVAKFATSVVEGIVDLMCPNGITANIQAKITRHNFDIEGKHAYGTKSESFMWPCAGAKELTFTNEKVIAEAQDKKWKIDFPKQPQQTESTELMSEVCSAVTINEVPNYGDDFHYYIASCKGEQSSEKLPADMAYVVGSESFLPTSLFKNENIGEGEPVFPVPMIQDYLLDSRWNLYATASEGNVLWVTCKDTKLFDGTFNNIIINDSFCGVAAPHVAIEVKQEISQDYTRPWAVTPDCLALNMTGLNCAYEQKAYHAFDGYGYRITDWLGSAGMSKEHYTWQYCFQKNDRFKRSNKLPPNQFLGNFQSTPSMDMDIHDDMYNEIAVVASNKGLQAIMPGEDRDQRRYSLPIFTEFVSSLPAVVRALSPYKLAVYEGITSLTTAQRTTVGDYKLPASVDFAINEQIYRITNEYICSVTHEGPSERVQQLVPTLGLTFLGASPYAAYLYNQATRQYYVYTGGMNLKVMDMLERFRDIKAGLYDFINQDIVMPCLATFDRLDDSVHDDNDEIDNLIVPVFRDGKPVLEVTPPNNAVLNTDAKFRTLSLPAGLTYQGPNRCIINRYCWSEYMLEDIKKNKGKWKKVPREDYHPFRVYPGRYTNITTFIESDLEGWTHNPFLLVTAPLGVNEETDCLFEWEITFAWTVEMEKIIEQNEYITVNVTAETFAPGGKVISRPTHIFLTKELFARSNNFGYYSFRYQSKNGAGNRERLHIWSDGYIAVSSLQLEYKIMTTKRNDILTQQADIKGYKEM